jgi:phage N-6-adenine-methyltransferase
VPYDIDDRATDPVDFARFHERFRFTVDASASPHNAKLPLYWTISDDGLAQDWTPHRVWVNPPYSNLRPWVEKAWTAADAGCPLVVMLLPANRTEQKWWQELVEPYRDEGMGLSVEFLPGRMRFIAPGADRIGSNERPPFGNVLLIFATLEAQ